MPIDKELIEGLIDDIRQRLVGLRAQEVTEEKLEDMFFLWGVEHGLQTVKDLGDIDEYIKQIAAYLVLD